MTTGYIRVGCDNESAGWKAGLLNPTVAVSNKYLGLLRAIRRLNHRFKTKAQVYHIYGHQYTHTAFHLLPRSAQLDIIVDDLAQREFDTAHEQ